MEAEGSPDDGIEPDCDYLKQTFKDSSMKKKKWKKQRNK